MQVIDTWTKVTSSTEFHTRLARRLLWKRFSPSLDEVVSHRAKEQAAHIVSTFFANFLLDNIDLVRQLEDAFRDMQHVPLDPILSELERRAQGRV
jgi:hypothetical protein